MARPLLVAVFAALSLAAQTPSARDPKLADILSFEMPHSGNCPNGWNCGFPATVFIDHETVHGGESAVRIERGEERKEPFSGILKVLPIDFSGKTIELRGFTRTEGVNDFCAFWMREDDETNASVGFASMQGSQPVKGTTPWTQHSISLPLQPEARTLFFGFLLSGAGKAWADDIELLVDGKPIWQAPKMEPLKTVLTTDHEFDGGSRIALTSLSAVQIDNLATLGKVWGFLKYHHPAIIAGKRHFDYDLLRVLPAILAAADRQAAGEAMLHWIDGLGDLTPCDPCAKLSEANLHLAPDLGWMADKTRLGDALSARLQRIHELRPARGKQFYVSLAANVRNPVFDNEPAYGGIHFPDAGFQILGLYRFWNIIEYWSPYRNVIGENWDHVLAEFLPRIALAKDRRGYETEMMALIARDHDTHANLWSSLNVRPPAGACQIPVNVRFIEDQAVVAGYSNAELGKESGLEPGDVIQDLDGEPVAKLVENWMPYYAASNRPTALRDMGRSLTHGDCGKPAMLRIRRENETLELTAERVPQARLDAVAASRHDQPGDTFRRLSKDVAYLKLSSVKAADAASYIDSAAGSKGLIIDIRNYPSEFVVFALGQLLVNAPTPFAVFTAGDLANPGAFHWGESVSLTPQAPHYSGKIVILVDEVSQSQAEYTSMAFRSAPDAVVIGSTTAGADGNVSQIPLPGGLRTMISGIGVFYPDKKPTQRIGILPDIVVKPTIEGIRAGRDELLEAAIRQIQRAREQ